MDRNIKRICSMLKPGIIWIVLTVYMVLPASAEIMVYASVEWLTVSSSEIFIGTISKIDSKKGEGDVIFDYLVVQVSDTIFFGFNCFSGQEYSEAV